MWLNFLILSSLLLLIAGAFLTLIPKNQLNPFRSKIGLNLSLVLALLLPCCLPNIPNYQQGWDKTQTFDLHDYNGWNVVDINDPELLGCYEKAKSSKDLCHCEISQKSKLLLYQPDEWKNWRLKLTPILGWGLLLVGLGLLLRLGLGLLGLFLTVKKSEKRLIWYEQKPVWLVYAHQGWAASCFGVGGNYIFWSAQLDALPEEEKRLILAHEYAHLKHKDSWQLIFWRLAELVSWFNPIFHLLKNHLQANHEYAADEYAAQMGGSRKNYAKLLLKMRNQQPTKAANRLVQHLAKSLLHQRISRLVKKEAQPAAWSPIFIPAMCILGLVLTATGAWAKPVLEREDIKLHQYQILKQANEDTGLKHICPSCLQPNG